jgi:hypothetical protein
MALAATSLQAYHVLLWMVLLMVFESPSPKHQGQEQEEGLLYKT